MDVVNLPLINGFSQPTNPIGERMGFTGDTGGSQTAGSAMAKLNRIQQIIQNESVVARLRSTRPRGYNIIQTIMNAQGTVTLLDITGGGYITEFNVNPNPSSAIVYTLIIDGTSYNLDSVVSTHNYSSFIVFNTSFRVTVSTNQASSSITFRPWVNFII
jgi:hypothetical protein